MDTVKLKPLEDKNFPSNCETEQLNFHPSCSQGTKFPVYRFGTKFCMDNSLFGAPLIKAEEEQSLLDSLLLGRWEDRMWKGLFRYDVTASEIKVIYGTKNFLVQLNGDLNLDCLQDPNEYKISREKNLLGYEWIKHNEKLLFCIASSDEAYSVLVPSAAVPDGSILIFVNVNPIEYGHIFLVPYGFNSLFQAIDAKSFEMIARVAVEINNGSFRLFYDCTGPITSPLHFEACYFPDLLPVELMPVETIFGDGIGDVRISIVTDYPVKTLLFESNRKFKIILQVLSEICSYLLDKNIPHNLLISDRASKIFLFLQQQTFPSSHSLSAWECGGYFLFRSKQQFDKVTEAELLKRLSDISLDDKEFSAVKQLCCSTARKFGS